MENNDPAQLTHAWMAGFNSERIRNAAGTIPSGAGGGIAQDAYKTHHGSYKGDNDGVEVHVRNVFFEWVPPDLVDVYITEQGQLTVADIAKHSETLGTEEERLFRDI